MAKASKVVTYLLILGLSVTPALARDETSGDLFNDKGWAPYNRPSVPSDKQKGTDVFPSNSFIVNPRADLFGSVRPNFDFGRDDMFVTHPRPIPDYPLFKQPQK